MRYKPKSIAALHIALGAFARSDARRSGPRRRSVCEDRWRTSKADRLAGEFDNSDAAGSAPWKYSECEQSDVATRFAHKS